MFKNLKDLNALQSQAREVQKQLADEEIIMKKDGMKIILNGNSEILSVEINPELTKEDQEKILKDLINDGVKKVQGLMARKMMGM